MSSENLSSHTNPDEPDLLNVSTDLWRKGDAMDFLESSTALSCALLDGRPARVCNNVYARRYRRWACVSPSGSPISLFIRIWGNWRQRAKQGGRIIKWSVSHRRDERRRLGREWEDVIEQQVYCFPRDEGKPRPQERRPFDRGPPTFSLRILARLSWLPRSQREKPWRRILPLRPKR